MHSSQGSTVVNDLFLPARRRKSALYIRILWNFFYEIILVITFSALIKLLGWVILAWDVITDKTF